MQRQKSGLFIAVVLQTVQKGSHYLIKKRFRIIPKYNGHF